MKNDKTIYKIIFDSITENVIIENWRSRISKDRESFRINGEWYYNDKLDSLIENHDDLGDYVFLTFDENKICGYKEKLKKIIIDKLKKDIKNYRRYIKNMS